MIIFIIQILNFKKSHFFHFFSYFFCFFSFYRILNPVGKMSKNEVFYGIGSAKRCFPPARETIFSIFFIFPIHSKIIINFVL